LRGRLPDPRRVDEVAVSPGEARHLHATIGTTLPLAVAMLDQGGNAIESWKRVTVHVVAIAQIPKQSIDPRPSAEDLMFGTPAFARRFATRAVGSTTYVLLKNPARDLPGFEAGLRREFADSSFQIKPARRELATFNRVTRPYTDTLWIFALVAALAGTLIMVQALARMVRADTADGSALRALGMTSPGRVAVATARAFVAIVSGALGAVVIAILVSPIFPLGVVRAVEPNPGISIDGFVLAAGATAIVLVLGIAVLAIGRWSTRPASLTEDDEQHRPSWVALQLGRLGAGVSVVTGTRLAFQRDPNTGRGSTAVSMFGLVAAIATTAAALVFGANLNQLTTPRRYGWTWDARVSSNGPGDLSSSVESVDRNPLLAGVTEGIEGDTTLAGRSTPTFGFESLRGHALPVATKGRLPSRATEIAAGWQTLHDLHRSVGDTVVATASNGTRVTLHIVGQTLLPSISSNDSSLRADEAAEMTKQGLVRLSPDVNGNLDMFLVDLAPRATLREVTRSLASIGSVDGPAQPGDIAGYGHVRATPLVLAGLLAVLGIGVLAHLLVTSVRSQRRELAILKTLGFTGGQIRLAVVWQAVALAIVALGIGLTAGIVFGQWAWHSFEATLGLAPFVDIPILSLGAIVAIVILLAAAIAAVPARTTAHTQPARVLRAQ